MRGTLSIPVHTWFDRETARKIGDRAAERGISKAELVRVIVEESVGSAVWSTAERHILAETLRNQALLVSLVEHAYGTGARIVLDRAADRARDALSAFLEGRPEDG